LHYVQATMIPSIIKNVITLFKSITFVLSITLQSITYVLHLVISVGFYHCI